MERAQLELYIQVLCSFVKALTYTHTHKEVGFVIIAVHFYFCNMQAFLRVNKCVSTVSALLPSPPTREGEGTGVEADCCRYVL